MCKELTLNSKNYNGITMEYPLIINASMTNTQICEALKKSFGCEVRTGTR